MIAERGAGYLPKLVLATGNKNKVREIQELLADLPFTIATIEDYPGLVMPEEDQPSFAGNAALKAEAVSKFSGELVLADDSGLEVDALGGRPGVYSARYAGEEGNYAANNQLLLQELSGLPPEQRAARFVCAIAICIPGDQTYIIEESCSGVIAEELKGKGGFGYDPLFIYEPAGLTFAEMSAEEKNKVSHRGRALKRVRKLLGKIFIF
ncbi:MAG: XTP/dITP diphosphatase [Firmicutes bacterium]|nr:XTP/dITP diphosphatase [Bacillota bacterium]